MEKTEQFEKAKMVGWYDFSQLKDTAIKTAISTIIGEYADPRAGTTDPRTEIFFNYSKKLERTADDFKPIEDKVDTDRREIWIDYVADVGDGWNSTYAVAYTLAKPEIVVPEREKPLCRGEILILGGDGVYPTATPDKYEQKLVMPYRMAFHAGESERGKDPANNRPADSDTVNLEQEPHIFALPGNHDWYDSLVAFKKVFCSEVFNRRKFAGAWRTRQKRSYFALKLPHNWWLLGVDLQLEHNIDLLQLEYFSTVVNKMDPGSRVILCVPEPYWVKVIKYEKFNLDEIKQKEKSIEKLENFFEERGVKIRAYIAGDLHHYRRFENWEGAQKITAGGGGAFLHPTHDFDFAKHDKEFIANPKKKEPEERGDQIRKSHFFFKAGYPGLPVSRKQDWKNLLFFWNNPKFGFVTAVIYPILAWLIHGKIHDGRFSWRHALSVTANDLINTPLALLTIILMFLALILFTDSNSPWQKWLGGFLHGAAHLTAAFVFGWLAYLLSESVITTYGIEGETLKSLAWFASVLLIPAAGGYFIGALIMGLYLFISLHFFHRHDNEAFSALRIEDFKNFLRLHIDTEGSLTIYPLKIETVPRQWKPVMIGDEADYFIPEDGSSPLLIEKPVLLSKTL
jgi:hypothetical protein